MDASIKRTVQCNENQEHAFSREELIKKLDDAIAAENKDQRVIQVEQPFVSF